jgi:YHS domain-containing protein
MHCEERIMKTKLSIAAALLFMAGLAFAAAREPINKRCPFTQKELAAGRSATYMEQEVGFCCQKCLDMFNEAPEKHIKKVKEFKKKK